MLRYKIEQDNLRSRFIRINRFLLVELFLWLLFLSQTTRSASFAWSVKWDRKLSVKKKGRAKFSAVNFFLAVFFRVMHDGLCERGTTCSLLFLSSTEKKACPLYFLVQRATLRGSQHFFNRLQLKPCIYPDSLPNQKLPFPITLESLTTKVDPRETQPKISIGKFPSNQFRIIINLGSRGLVHKDRRLSPIQLLKGQASREAWGHCSPTKRWKCETLKCYFTNSIGDITYKKTKINFEIGKIATEIKGLQWFFKIFILQR